MNTEILKISELLKDAYNGKPWFGKSVLEILSTVKEEIVFEKVAEQHSIAEMVWHMVYWRQFVLNCIRKEKVQHLEGNDWPVFDKENHNVWKEGLQQLQQMQTELINLIEQQKDDLLEDRVEDRTYNYRKLLHGLVQHDVYHLGQVAYLNNLLNK